MSISFYKSVLDSDEVNLCNRNAMMVLRFLGVEPDYCGSINAKELSDRCETALATLKQFPDLDPEVDNVESLGENGARVIECGLPEGYLIERISSLKQLADSDIYGEIQWA